MNNQYISIVEFCESYQLEHSFISELTENGLLEILIIEETEYVDRNQLLQLERMARMHHDLEINVQGIDVVNNLLDRLSHLQQEVRLLQNRLRRFED